MTMKYGQSSDRRSSRGPLHGSDPADRHPTERASENGRLQAGRADSPRSADPWERACRLLVFLVLFLVPCLYPLRLPDKAIEALRSRTDSWWYEFYISQLDTFVNHGYSPLRLKEGAFSVLVVVLLLCWFIHQVRRAQSSGLPARWSFDWKIYGPIAAMLIWAAVSLLYSPTFYYSLTTYGLLAAGLIWFIVTYEMPKSARLVRRWFNTILVAGAVVAFFAFLQDVDRRRIITGLLFVDIESAARGDPTLLRLRMGSLIGHNIGVASFLTFSWFILLSRLFQPAPRGRKILWTALLVLLFYVIAAAQTRGIWIILVVLTPIHLVWLMRLTGKRWDLRPVLGMILIVLIVLTLQIIPSPRNPFYSPESPLLLRFTHFTPSHLLTETRLRIAVCSGSLVASRPLQGHGLGSFQYVYPAAQADYFARHPDTVLMPSPNRTMRAHSDWLQVVIELGLVGLIIVLAGLYLALRRGWNSWCALADSRLRLELTAVLMSVAGVMFHAMADFPMHVVSTAAPAIFMLAVWTSCGRIGRAEDRAARASPGKTTAARAAAVAGLAAMVPASIGAAAWFYSVLHASMYESLGTSYRIYYGDRFAEMNDRERLRVLDAAYSLLKRGKKLAPLDRQLSFRLGEVATLRGVFFYLKFQKLSQSDDATTAAIAAARRDADRWLRLAIGWLGPRACQKEVRYHEVFHYLGMAHEHLYRLYGLEHERQLAKRYYRLAVRYSPCFARSLYRLFLLLREDRPPNEAEMREVCRRIARYDPQMFLRNFTWPVQETIRRRDYARAAVKIDVLLDVQPDRPELWLDKIHLLAYAGRGAEAAALLERFRKRFADVPEKVLYGYYMEVAAATGRYDEAARYATRALAVAGSEPVEPLYRCVRAAALEKSGRPEGRQQWQEIERLAAKDPRYLSTAAEVFLFLIRDRERAYHYLIRACESDVQPDAALFRIAAEMSWKRGEKQRAVRYLERALELDPKDPLALNLLKSIK